MTFGDTLDQILSIAIPILVLFGLGGAAIGAVWSFFWSEVGKFEKIG